jgi:hypothetical protein
MTELTIEQANKMHYIDWVKHFKPDWTDEQCEFYLWEYTCFPFGFKETIKQLNEQLLNKHYEIDNLNFNGAAIIGGNLSSSKKATSKKSH